MWDWRMKMRRLKNYKYKIYIRNLREYTFQSILHRNPTLFLNHLNNEFNPNCYTWSYISPLWSLENYSFFVELNVPDLEEQVKQHNV